MSSLGQYVHATWAGYKQSGTFENQVNNPEQRSNYKGRSLFVNHKNYLIKQAAMTLQKPNLKQLEKEYNEKNTIVYNLLKDIINKDNKTDEENILLQTLIKSVNTKWSQMSIEKIIASLKAKDNVGGIYYSGAGLEDKTYQKQRAPIARLDLQSNQKNFYIKPLYQKLLELERGLKDLDLNANEFEQSIADLKNLLKTHATTSIIVDGQSLPSGLINYQITLTQQANRTIPEIINSLVDMFNTTAEISAQLEWKLAEIIGQTAAIYAPQLTIENITSILSSGSGTKGTTWTTKIDNPPTIFKGFTNDALIANSQFAKEILSWNIEDLGAGRAQKADIVFKGIGISMKKTSMFVNPNIPAEQQGISLQSSSLLLYLAGIQSLSNNLGTHYMNLLVQHPDEDGSLNSLRATAFDSLYFAILYSALTGKYQLRTGGQASVLAVWDTSANVNNGANRVKLFDMYDILMHANPYTNVYFDPSLETISNSLQNIKEPAIKGKIREASNLRISKILVALKNQIIKVSLSKNFLLTLK